MPPDKETACRVAHGGTGGGLAGDRRKIAAMTSCNRSTNRRADLRPCVREPG